MSEQDQLPEELAACKSKMDIFRLFVRHLRKQEKIPKENIFCNILEDCISEYDKYRLEVAATLTEFNILAEEFEQGANSMHMSEASAATFEVCSQRLLHLVNEERARLKAHHERQA